MELIIIGALGGATYALQGIFKNKYELSNEFKLDPVQCGSSIIVGGIAGGIIGATGLAEPEVLTLITSIGLNKGVKAALKILIAKLRDFFLS